MCPPLPSKNKPHLSRLCGEVVPYDVVCKQLLLARLVQHILPHTRAPQAVQRTRLQLIQDAHPVMRHQAAVTTAGAQGVAAGQHVSGWSGVAGAEVGVQNMLQRVLLRPCEPGGGPNTLPRVGGCHAPAPAAQPGRIRQGKVPGTPQPQLWYSAANFKEAPTCLPAALLQWPCRWCRRR